VISENGPPLTLDEHGHYRGRLGKDRIPRRSLLSMASAKQASSPEGEVPGLNNVGSLTTQREGVGPTLASLLGERQRLIDPCQGHDVAWILGFEFGEQTLEEGRVQLVSLLGVRRQGLSKLRHAGHTVA
jgi:hypothetical protein